MYCNNCGSLLPDGAKFCQQCGARQVHVSNSQQNSDESRNSDYTYQEYEYKNTYDNTNDNQWNNIEYTAQTPSQSHSLSMGWFNFIINVELLVGPIIGLIDSLITLFGFDFSGESIYDSYFYDADFYNSIFEGIDFGGMIGAWVSIPLFIFAFFVRYRLSNYYKDGPGLLSALYGFGIAKGILVSCVMAFFMPSFEWTLLLLAIAAPISVVPHIIMMIVNKKYLERRSYLFEDMYY